MNTLEWKKKLRAFKAILNGQPTIYGMPLSVMCSRFELEGLTMVDSPVLITQYQPPEGVDRISYCMFSRINSDFNYWGEMEAMIERV